MNWIVYRKRDLAILKRFILQKDAERYCRQRIKREFPYGCQYGNSPYGVAALNGMKISEWKTWTGLQQ